MRKMKICALVLLCILTASLCGVFAYGMSGHSLHINYWGGGTKHELYSSVQLLLEKEVSLDGIDSVSIRYDMNNNDVYLYESKGNYLTVKEYSELALEENELSTVQVTGSSIAVEGKKRDNNELVQIGMRGVRSPICYTEIGLPVSYKGQLSIATVNGDVESQMDIALENAFRAVTRSGDITIPDITAQSITLRCVSGDIQADTVRADAGSAPGAVQIRTSNGNIKAGQLAGEMDIESVSGDITLSRINGKTDIKTSNGNIESDAISGETQLVTTSGDITVKRLDGTVTVTSSNGNVNILAGGGARAVKTISGDVRLEGVDSAWDVKTSNGSITIKADQGSGDIQTTSGDIGLALEQLTGNLNIESSDGSVEIRLCGDNAFDFKAVTTNGDIDTFFDDALNFSKKGNSAQGTYGDNQGSRRIDIRTISGDVEVTR